MENTPRFPPLCKYSRALKLPELVDIVVSIQHYHTRGIKFPWTITKAQVERGSTPSLFLNKKYTSIYTLLVDKLYTPVLYISKSLVRIKKTRALFSTTTSSKGFFLKGVLERLPHKTKKKQEEAEKIFELYSILSIVERENSWPTIVNFKINYPIQFQFPTLYTKYERGSWGSKDLLSTHLLGAFFDFLLEIRQCQAAAAAANLLGCISVRTKEK